MDQVTQKEAASTEETASAAEELAGQSNGLRDIVERLTVLVGSENRHALRRRGQELLGCPCEGYQPGMLAPAVCHHGGNGGPTGLGMGAQRQPEPHEPWILSARDPAARPWRLVLPLATAIFLGLGFLALVSVFARTMAVIIVAITIADALAPIVAWLQRRMRRTLAVVLVYLGLIGILALLAWILAPRLAAELGQLSSQGPELLADIQHRISVLLPLPGNDSGRLIAQAIQRWSDKLMEMPLAIGSGMLLAVIVFFLSLYWLIASPALGRFIRSLFPPATAAHVDSITLEMSRAMGGYLRAVTINGLIIGLLSWIGLEIIGVDAAFALAVIAFLGEYVPYVGAIVAAVPAVLAALLQSPGKAVWVALLYLALHQIEGHILTPNIMRSQTNVPRPLVIAALLAGGLVGGLLGALVAVPIAGAGRVLIEALLVPAVRRATKRESPSQAPRPSPSA